MVTAYNDGVAILEIQQFHAIRIDDVVQNVFS